MLSKWRKLGMRATNHHQLSECLPVLMTVIGGGPDDSILLIQSSRSFKSDSKSSSQAQKISYLSDPGNTGKATGGVNFDTLGSWNNRLKFKIDVSESIRSGTLVPKILLSTIGMKSLIGRRATNEDRFVIEELRPNILLFGIFDGHGGNTAVDYVQECLPKLIGYWLDRGDNLEDVLRKSFIEINNSFTKFIHHNQLNSDSTHYAPSSGTSATICLIKNGVQLTIAHVGDSRAILCRDNKSVRLTVDHLPSVKSEADRIIRCKGHLTWSSLGRERVNGRLEMTRSIGDIELKPYGVIADPEVKTLKIRNSTDSFLALTTDGIHGRLNTAEIVRHIGSCIDPHEAADFLTDQALLFGSEDNCSILVIPFGAWGKYMGSSRPVHFGHSRNPTIGSYG